MDYANRLRRIQRTFNRRFKRLEEEIFTMSANSEKVLAEAIETQGKVDTVIVVLEAVRAELEAIKNQNDPHLVEAIAILDGVQGKIDTVMAAPEPPVEDPPFDPSAN
jgi:hypothetical protein